MKKVMPWAALVIAVMWIIHNPSGAAATLHSLVSGLSTFASGL